jgi:hypothetical protein
MLPHYPNNPRRNHQCVYQQEQPSLPNPTVAAFLMPVTTASWDEYGAQIFPAADMYSQQQETLETVLWQAVTAQQQQPAAERDLIKSTRGGAAAPAVDGAARAAILPRRRPQRKDRHSKIRTAQGVRDRRMRLSAGVARDFCALQDRLGFDKASKTVNWLLVQSKPAIDSLCGATVPGAPVFGQPRAPVVKGKERKEGSSSNTAGCFKDTMRSRGALDPPVAFMEDRGGSGLDWNMSEAAAAAPATTELTWPMDGLEYYQYWYQLEEMMRCNNTEESYQGDFLFD